MSQPSNQDPQTQPDPSPAFSATHTNPYNQKQAYVPPNQYGTLNPQESSSDSLTAELEIKQIDQQLSSGWYACYKCWLYFMVIVDLLAFVLLIFHERRTPSMILYAVECFVMANYAIAMIGALKDKDLARAKNGYKIAIAILVIMIIFVAIDSLMVWYLYTPLFALKYSIGIVPSMFIFYFFVIYNPAAKVIGHLERREALLQQTTSPYNA